MIGRRAALVTCVVLALAATAGTGGFASVSAERDAAVVVADDDRAMPRVDLHALELRNGRHEDVRLATLTNTFPTTITSLDVEVSSETMIPPKPTSSGSAESAAPLRVGEATALTADVTCGATGRTERFSVEMSVLTRSGASVEMTREATVECTGEPNKGVSGRGNDRTDDAHGNATD
ncbi:hypothetical protein [Halomicrobium salinisoli]|uniref:hypothetical protein n=1 Tax=Halomicrobium salinisoli TaxID=2878391 RepID=UPI001CF020FE|nr:hypothetical protein [Halomicrobium salinisoli]